jgi:hypothetical protein
MGASRRDRRKSLLGILAEHPGGMLMEALIREAAAPTDRLVPRIVRSRNMASSASDGRRFWSRQTAWPYRCNRR